MLCVRLYSDTRNSYCEQVVMILGNTVPSAKWFKHVPTHCFSILNKWNSSFRERTGVSKQQQTRKTEPFGQECYMCQENYHIYICLQERGFLKRISYCRTGYLPFINRIVIFTGLVQGILRWCIGYCSFCIEFCILKKVAANWKTCYIWYKHIVYFSQGYYTIWKIITLFDKECCTL